MKINYMLIGFVKTVILKLSLNDVKDILPFLCNI